MECFSINREKSNDSETYKPSIGKEWIVSKDFTEECKEVIPVNYICCQAYVQILFEEKGKWVHGMIGELVVYKKEQPPDEEEMALSFFSGPRQRFVIKVSEIQKLSKTHPNLLVIIHGKTIMGLNFPLEHQNRVDVFYQQLRPYLPSTIFAQRLKKVADNVSEEMKKKASKLRNTFSIDENQWFNNPKKMITKIVQKDASKPKGTNIRRLSDPLLCPPKASKSDPRVAAGNPKLLSEAPHPIKVADSEALKQLSQKNNTIERVNVKKRVTFATDHHESSLRRSQSLRKFYDEEVWIQYTKYSTADTDDYGIPTNVKNLIELWNSKS